ncbi:MAG TPA: NAD-dependent DNA ligase LigA [Candidatus Saccharimonadales bacterium]|nr:NAD-dependent DNA ligase LigA [Candidatus Saccharimonadales bacterium]
MKQMNRPQAAARIEKLRELINEYRYEYHVHDRSIMDEAAADSLKHELSQLEEQFPDLITPDSPTQRVAGAVLSKFKSVPHTERMISLNDVFSREEVEAWLKRITKLANQPISEFLIDIKMDGFSCALVYEDGVFVQAVTRGDGTVGEDVTANVKTIESVPLRLSDVTDFVKGRLEIRGEIIMTKDNFTTLNADRQKKGLPLFANPRNLAAGTIRQLDPKLVMERPLQFRSYDIIVGSNDRRQTEISTNIEVYDKLTELGFIRNPMAKMVKSIDEIMKFAKTWEDKRHDLPFNTDGLVVKVNDRRLFRRLGIVGKAPRAAIAYKFPAEQSTTKVKDIFVSIGRTGAATPVAVLEPVVVAGSTVQMATLHNENEVKRKDIRIGDTVIIHKAGDIIPEVVESLKKLRTGREKVFVMPTHCPECNTKLVKQDKDAVWRCPNVHCPARLQNLIQHYASKAALDIDGMGEKNVNALLDNGLIKDVADLYALTADQLKKLDRFADVSAKKLVEAIASSKHPPLGRFIFGLGIRHVGSQTAEDLANHFHSLEKFREATVDELHGVDGVGEIVAESIVAWFGTVSHQKLLARLEKVGVRPQMAAGAGGPLTGKSFVITGTLESMEREEAGEAIRAKGGTFSSGVGKATSYLVVGENPGQSKRTQAKKLSVLEIDEKAFLKLLNA